jgi:hypothetical protein
MSERRRIILLSLLVIVTAYWAYFTIQRRSERQAEAQAQKNNVGQKRPDTLRAALLDSAAVMILSERPWGKDPFYHNYTAPRRRKVQAQVHFRLLGILYDDRDPQALLNGVVVSVGDRVEGYTVTKITKDFVEVHGPEGVRRLSVKRDSS